MSQSTESQRPELDVTPQPPSLPATLPSASQEVASPPESVISFVSLLSQPRSDTSNGQVATTQSLAFANVDKVEEELCCPICHDIMKEVIATSCGHSFCYECICEQIKYQPECPLFNRLAELRTQMADKNVPIYKSDPMDALIRKVKSDSASIATSIARSLNYEELKIKSDLLDIFLVRLKNRNESAIQRLLLQNKYISSDLDMLDLTTREDDQQTDDQSTEDTGVREDTTRAVSRSRASEDEVEEKSVSDRIDERFNDLKDLYHSKMTSQVVLDEEERCSRLESFSSALYDVTRYSRLEVLDTLYYADTTHGTSIVSSVEFDKDDEFFAVGGILKDIKIFDFRMTCRGSSGRTPMHCPLRRIRCENKISCVSWSPYIKSQIASSDYQGIINVWDVNTGQRTVSFNEHKKRAWSVDICTRNPGMIASGSDDTTVKVWSLTSQRSCFTFQHKGNICCAKFAPNNSNYLAVGSADHHIICYDLRNPNLPLSTCQGHQKAVSYVKWMNDNELISAESSECLRTYTGHLNEKNFVGLSVNEDWIVCGSETNTVHAYHKHSKTPVAKYRFPIDPVPGKLILENDPTYFVSSVCWKKDTTRLLSANSKGAVRVLQLK
ncbi:WD40-repeat-containing domain protein [Sporodiniella umbellata]|nr:WD40-repeat-containing domain protein [Sporodiniella umbellata]